MFAQKQSNSLFLFLCILLLSGGLLCRAEENQQCTASNSICSNSVKLITAEELSSKTGMNGSEIWLAIMGEVYDVSAGAEFYGTGEGYSFFAGRDASVTFVTGQFNEEGLKKSLVDMDENELGGVESWRLFYNKHEKYKFKGLLIGELYDLNGNPTPGLNRLKEKLKKAS